MTDKDTDDTEQPSRDELESRVEQLEQTVQQMLPSRRDALKLGGTALAAGALGSAASGSASAGTNSVGTIGSPSSPVDAELEDVNPGSVRAVEFNNNEITGVSSLSTDEINITNELLIDVFNSSDQSYSSSNGFVAVQYDTKNKDVTGVFDLSNNDFSPSEDGYYHVAGQVMAASSGSSDSLLLRLRNTTDFTTVVEAAVQATGSKKDSVIINRQAKLLSSKTYQIQFRNLDGGDLLLGGDSLQFLGVSRLPLA